jgi:hypothetical protein
MQVRSPNDRRRDRLTAERFDLAILTARAFDVRAGQSYLRLSGVSTPLVQRFVDSYPNKVRATRTTDSFERRRRRT